MISEGEFCQIEAMLTCIFTRDNVMLLALLSSDGDAFNRQISILCDDVTRHVIGSYRYDLLTQPENSHEAAVVVHRILCYATDLVLRGL